MFYPLSLMASKVRHLLVGAKVPSFLNFQCFPRSCPVGDAFMWQTLSALESCKKNSYYFYQFRYPDNNTCGRISAASNVLIKCGYDACTMIFTERASFGEITVLS